MPKAKRPPIPLNVSVEVAGKTYEGTYIVDRGMVTVSSQWGSKSAKAGASPSTIARIMLGELLREAGGRSA